MMRGCAEVVRRPHKPKVVGSSPTPATKKYRGVAELVDAEEQSIWF